MSTWDEIKDSPAGTEFTDKDGDVWQFTETEVVNLNSGFLPENRKNGCADRFFGGGYFGPYIVTSLTPRRPEPTRVWSEHLADIARALKIINRLQWELSETIPLGEVGHDADLTYKFPARVPILVGGVDVGWSLAYSEDNETWMFEMSGDSND